MPADVPGAIPGGSCYRCRIRLEAANPFWHIAAAYRAVRQCVGQCRGGVLGLRSGGDKALYIPAPALLSGANGGSRLSQDRPRRGRCCCAHRPSGGTVTDLSTHWPARLRHLCCPGLSEAISRRDAYHGGQCFLASPAGYLAANASGKGRRSGPRADQRELVRRAAPVGEARDGGGCAAPYRGYRFGRAVPASPASRYGDLFGDPASGLEASSHQMLF